MSNYPDTNERLERLEKALSDLQEQVRQLVKRLEDLKEEVAPAVQAQMIRDQWYGF